MYFLLGLLAGCIVLYLFLKPRLKTIAVLNEEIKQENMRLEQQHQELQQQCEAQKNIVSSLQIEQQVLSSSKDSLNNEIKNFKQLMQQEKEQLNEYKESLREQVDLYSERVSKEFAQAAEEYQNEYELTLSECIQDFSSMIETKQVELAQVEHQLLDMRQKVSAAVEFFKREQEKKEKKNFYRLSLSTEDIEEIEKLREVAKILRDSEPLNKVIWKVYYENAFTDLCGRVVGKQIRTGIYKITNIQNNMCYIGQAKDIASRWGQHCKRGVGADTPTKNKLYPAMLQFGIENFTFEIIEDCNVEQLNEREKFWQEYFKAKEFGYSIK